MLKIDGAYLYELGKAIKPLTLVEDSDTKRIDIYFQCLIVRRAISGVLHNSVFSERLRVANRAAINLLKELEYIAPDASPEIDWDEVIPSWRVTAVKVELDKFEAVLIAEFKTSDVYYASAKGGYDTPVLIDNGEMIFPPGLGFKVPEAIDDVRSATKCIAFDLPTAAAFHLHRANESVL